MDIKLIPKEYKKQQSNTSAELRLPFSKKPIKSKLLLGLWERMNIWLIITIALLVFSLLMSGFLFIYKEYLAKQNTKLTLQLETLDSQRDTELESQYKDLGLTVLQLKKLLTDHVYPSKIFELLIEKTISQVQYTDFQADLEEGTINLVGRTPDYRTLAQQMKVLLEDERLVDVSTSNIKLHNQEVSFNMTLKIDPQYLKYQSDNFIESEICK